MRRLVFLAAAAMVLFGSGHGSETPPLFLKVTAIPTVIVAHGLEEFARHEGYLPPDALQARLQAGNPPTEAE